MILYHALETAGPGNKFECVIPTSIPDIIDFLRLPSLK